MGHQDIQTISMNSLVTTVLLHGEIARFLIDVSHTHHTLMPLFITLLWYGKLCPYFNNKRISMKVQEGVLDMLKNVCGCVENLENSLAALEDHKSVSQEKKLQLYLMTILPSFPPCYPPSPLLPPSPFFIPSFPPKRMVASVYKALDDDDQFQGNALVNVT